MKFLHMSSVGPQATTRSGRASQIRRGAVLWGKQVSGLFTSGSTEQFPPGQFHLRHSYLILQRSCIIFTILFVSLYPCFAPFNLTYAILFSISYGGSWLNFKFGAGPMINNAICRSWLRWSNDIRTLKQFNKNLNCFSLAYYPGDSSLYQSKMNRCI